MQSNEAIRAIREILDQPRGRGMPGARDSAEAVWFQKLYAIQDVVDQTESD